MTRINTNVSSLNAQKTLARSNNALQEALTRLSTGLRINKGKDDPAGLIASEVLRADIVSVERAITNSNRANQMIATADSALGQVSSLLNDIRGLISEGANTGAMSDEQIAANQLQIDSSLEAIDRISQVTQFQGQRLLDGNLDFLTENINTSQITDMNIEQANFGSQSQIDVSLHVTTQATQASLNYGFGAVASDVVLEVGGKDGFEAFSFASGSSIQDMAAAINLVSDALGITAEVQTEATEGAVTTSSFGADNDIVLTAMTAGFDEGNIRVKYTADPTGNATLDAVYTAPSGIDPGTIDVALETSAWVNAQYTYADDDGINDNAFTITADEAGADYNGYTLVIGAPAAGEVVFSAVGKTITVTPNTADAAQIVIDLNADARFASMFTAAAADGSDGSGNPPAATYAPGTNLTTTGEDGGTILSTANEVVDMINAKAILKDDIVASLATSNDGHEVVSGFQESASYGTAASNNQLQFLGVENAENIRLVSTPGASLGVDLSTASTQEGFASSVINLGVDQGTIQILARNKGAEYDDVSIKFAADTGLTKGLGWAVWDDQNKELTIFADQAADDVDDIVGYINDSHVVKDYFRATTFGTADGTAVIPAIPTAGNTVGTTSGGLVSEGTVIVNLATDADGLVTTTAQNLIDYFDDTANAATLSGLGISVSNAEGSSGAGLLGATTSDIAFATTGTTTADANASVLLETSGGINSMITITADIAGTAYEGVQVEFDGTAAVAADPVVSYDATSKKLTISIQDGVTTASDVITAINTDYPDVADLFTAAVATDVFGSGTDSTGAGLMYITDGGTTTGGTSTTGTAAGTGLLGNSDEADTGLTFKASEYGSDAFVSIKALNGTSFAVTNAAGDTTERSTGTDIDARINGVQAIGAGLSASLNTSALDLNFSVSSSVTSTTTMTFSITGGGAQFQLGPDVVSNQQARMGISSVNTAKLGGTSGRLFELRSGKGKSLANDVSGAASVVEQVITQIVNLRGRLGAFQRTTLDTNINALGDTLEALTAAESDIRDADFAAESANLTRAQVLVQSGLSVLSIANSNPQSVLSLLR
jgi:flagellin